MATSRKSAARVPDRRNGNGGGAALKIAASGVKNSREFIALFSALIADTLSHAVTPHEANACCNAGGKMIKMVELEERHGRQTKNRPRALQLAR